MFYTAVNTCSVQVSWPSSLPSQWDLRFYCESIFTPGCLPILLTYLLLSFILLLKYNNHPFFALDLSVILSLYYDHYCIIVICNVIRSYLNCYNKLKIHLHPSFVSLTYLSLIPQFLLSPSPDQTQQQRQIQY